MMTIIKDRKIKIDILRILLCIMLTYFYFSLDAHKNNAIISKDVFIKDINIERAKVCKCGRKRMKAVDKVIWNNTLEKVALAHAIYLSKKQKLSHYGYKRSTPGDRIKAKNYTWKACAENIAYGKLLNQKSVLQSWMKSSVHCKNIMNGVYTEIGLAVVEGYWVLVFATPLK